MAHQQRSHRLVLLVAVLGLSGCGKDKPKGDDKGSAKASDGPKLPPGKYKYPVNIAGAPDGKAAGYIDENGTVVIKPAFAQATWFSEGLAQVQVGGLWGYIDDSGKLVIPAKFKQDEGAAAMANQNGGNAFHDGVAIVRDPATDKQIVIDKTGATTWVVDGTLSSGFAEGLALYNKEIGHAVFVDPTGKVVIDEKYTHAQGFSEGLAAVKYLSSWTYIDPTGKRLDKGFYLAQPFSDGRALVWEGSSGPGRYIDKTGAVVIPGPFGGESSRSFSSGVASVAGAVNGWIDTNGKEIAALASYNGLFNSFMDGMMLIDDSGETIRYVDTTGKVIDTKLPSNGSRAGPFHDGLAKVTTVSDTIVDHYIDKTGKQIYPR